MKLRWDGQFRKAEETNDWAWWALFGVTILMIILVILKVSGKI